MAASAWAYTRLTGTPSSILAAIPNLSGADGVRLRVRDERRPIDLPVGTTCLRGTWHSGSDSGDVELTLIPFYAWGSELHIAVSAPESRARRAMWRSKRLSRLAHTLIADVS